MAKQKQDIELGKGKGGKNIRKARAKIDDEKTYLLGEGVSALKETLFAKFDETLEVILELGVDTKHADQQVRGVVSMPNGTGKQVKVAVFAKDEKAKEALEAGADMVGADELVDEIKAGKVEYDCYIATPDMMGVVGKVAKILGPKGLMPNPKLGTVTTDVKKVVNERKSGQVEFRAEKAGIIHAGVAKKSFSNDKIVENVRAFIDAVIKAKPTGAKGTYLKFATLSSSMGPSLKLDTQDLIGSK